MGFGRGVLGIRGLLMRFIGRVGGRAGGEGRMYLLV